MPVEQLAQVVFDAERDTSGDQAPPIGERPAHEHHGQDRERQHQQRFAVVGSLCQLMRLHVPGAFADHLHCAPGQRGQRHGHHHRDAREPPGDGEAAPVGTQEAEQPPEGRHRVAIIVARSTILHLARCPRAALGWPHVWRRRRSCLTSGVQRARAGPPAGLCDTCVHQQLVHNTRGSTFSLCRRSREDPGYPRYPRLPVLTCHGYEPDRAGSLRHSP